MSQVFTITKFEQSHEAAVVALWHACGLTRPWNDPSKDIARKVALDDGLFLLGWVDQDLIASVMGGYDGHRGWLYYLGVHPDHQRFGYGRRMVEAMETELLALGCPKVNLQVRQEGVAAVQFYEALGYDQDTVLSLGKRLIPDQ